MITKQQIIDKLNELTDDPNEEIFGFWDDNVWEIHDITIQSYSTYAEKGAPPYSDPQFRHVPLHITASYKKICIDCS